MNRLPLRTPIKIGLIFFASLSLTSCEKNELLQQEVNDLQAKVVQLQTDSGPQASNAEITETIKGIDKRKIRNQNLQSQAIAKQKEIEDLKSKIANFKSHSITLTNGDRLEGSALSYANGKILFKSNKKGKLTIPVQEIETLNWSSSR